MKFLSGLLVVLLAVIVSDFIFTAAMPNNASVPQLEAPETPEQVETTETPSSIVRLHSKDGQFFCSGVVISNIHILTAAHCVEPDEVVEIRDMHNRKTGTSATVAGLNQRADYAILIGNFKKFAKMKAVVDPQSILNGILNNERKIIACGFPWSGNLFCSPVTDRRQFAFQIAGNGFLYPGMSGGPVIDVATGNVIGVNSAVTESIILFTPIVEIFRNLDVKPE